MACCQQDTLTPEHAPTAIGFVADFPFSRDFQHHVTGRSQLTRRSGTSITLPQRNNPVKAITECSSDDRSCLNSPNMP